MVRTYYYAIRLLKQTFTDSCWVPSKSGWLAERWPNIDGFMLHTIQDTIVDTTLAQHRWIHVTYHPRYNS